MVNQQLINFFKEGVEKGHSLDSLKKSLLDQGWSGGQVNAVKSEFSGREELAIPEVQKKVFSEKQRPLGVTLVAIFHWLMVIEMIVGSIIISTLTVSQEEGIFALIAGGFFVAIIITIAVLSILPLLVGIGIWKGKNGWRIVAIVFGFIAIIGGLGTLAQPNVLVVINLLISMAVVGYLLFSKEGKKYFGK